MSVVATIAGHVVRDAVRSRVLHGVTLFVAGMALTAPIAGRLSAGQDLKVVKDLGLAAIHLAGLLVAVSMGIRLVAWEMARRTADAVLSKPVRRHEFIVGQYVGLVATLGLALAVMTAFLYALMGAAAWWAPETGFMPAPPAPAADPAILKAVFLILVQLAVVAAASLCFSTFASPALAAVAACALYVAGHFSAELRRLDEVVDSPLAASLAAGLSYVLPNLAAFDVKNAVVHQLPVTAWHVALTTLSGTAYILAFLVLAAAAFSRRDLT